MAKSRDSSDAAAAAYIAKKGEIDTMLCRLQQHSADHFNIDPDRITWGDVGTLSHYAELLKRVSNSAFHEGEYAD